MSNIEGSHRERMDFMKGLNETLELSSDKKDILVGMLEDGVNIRPGDKTSYYALKGLAEWYLGIDFPEFEKIQDKNYHLDTKGFTLTIDKGSKRAYVYPIEIPGSLSFSTAVGYIENGSYVSRSIIGRVFSQYENPNNNTDFSYTPAPRVPSPKLTEIPKPKQYPIKHGDTLWKIVKKWYGLKDPNDIANAINVLVKENKDIHGLRKDILPKDRILGDVLRDGQIITLPPELNILRNTQRNKKIQRIDTTKKQDN